MVGQRRVRGTIGPRRTRGRGFRTSSSDGTAAKLPELLGLAIARREDSSVVRNV